MCPRLCHLSSYRINTSTLSTDPLLLVPLCLCALFPSTTVSSLHMHTFITKGGYFDDMMFYYPDFRLFFGVKHHHKKYQCYDCARARIRRGCLCFISLSKLSVDE
uniref:Expressed protein n=1 Tax=Echinococcus granulosus TaxID=6210 RepID=A0A068WMD6_ECHGR|nr:expressed protein [Echinococcus granulosus]